MHFESRKNKSFSGKNDSGKNMHRCVVAADLIAFDCAGPASPLWDYS